MTNPPNTSLWRSSETCNIRRHLIGKSMSSLLGCYPSNRLCGRIGQSCIQAGRNSYNSNKVASTPAAD